MKQSETALGSKFEGRPSSDQERLWLRALRGELDEAESAAMLEELDRDPASRMAFERWSAAWHEIRLPDAELESSLVPSVMEHLRAEVPGTLRWSLAPAWARAGAAAALVSGLVLGFGIENGLSSSGISEPGSSPSPSALVEGSSAEDELDDFLSGEELFAVGDSLARAYWLALEASGEEEES